MNIVVGGNNEGKSTLLQAINLALTGTYDAKRLSYGFSPDIFNNEINNKYCDDIKTAEDKLQVEKPKIEIELYFNDNEKLNAFIGNNNSLRENCAGVKCILAFNDDYQHEYKRFLEKIGENGISNIPVEYYSCKLFDFADNVMLPLSVPISVNYIDIVANMAQYTPDKHFIKILKDKLDDIKKAELNISFRNLKESFSGQESIKELNKDINETYKPFINKDISLNMDITSKTSWESSLTSYFDETPFNALGQGEQSLFKIKIALLPNAEKVGIVLIEEPESHLSYSALLELIAYVNEKFGNNQIFISTHNNYVLNKLELKNVIMLQNNTAIKLKDLSPDTNNYFSKLSGFNTLRVILSKSAILVEGASDELIFSKLYKQKHNKYPQENGVDIISLNGLSFKRYLEIGKLLDTDITVITDNDGSHENKTAGFADYMYAKCKLLICNNNTLKTLENIIVFNNELAMLNEIFDKNFATKEEMLEFMLKNKTECAYKLFTSDKTLVFDEVIYNAL